MGRYVTDEGTLVIPGAYPSLKVQQQNSGLATSGVIVLVGEADAGPAWSDEADLSTNFFAPTELSDVIGKYKSGNVVDAFRSAANSAKDPRIAGAPSFIYVVKTNVSGKATGVLARSGLSDYGTLADKSYGKLGNLIYASVLENVAETAAETGSIVYVPGPELGASDGSSLAVRVNGGAKQTAAIAALDSPPTLVATLNALTGVMAVGGEDRGAMVGMGALQTLALVASGYTVTIALGSGAWTKTPVAGDLLVIPQASTYGVSDLSVIAGSNGAGPNAAADAAGKNLGAYVVVSATANTVTAVKLRDAASTGVTAPETVNAVAIGAEAADLICYSPINLKNMTGTNRGTLTGLVGKSVAGTATGPSLKLTLQTGSVWAALPKVNDVVQIAATAPAAIRAAADANVGWYKVTAATSGVSAGASTITMTRLSNGNPVTFAPTALAATSDLGVYRPAVDGLAKSLELYDNAGNINCSTLFFTTAGTAAPILSTAGSPKVLTSAAEQRVTLKVNRQADGVANSIDAGGDVVLKVGYAGTTASMTVTATTLTTSVVGGNGANLSITLADFKKLSDLAAYINSQTGYTAAVASNLYGQFSPSVLDQGTFGICSDLGAKPGLVKKDADDFFKRLSGGSATVQLGVTAAKAASGLPEVQDSFYLSGGSKGGTTSAGILAAVDALSKLRVNFVVPLFSRDAADDIADGLTESASDYTIAGIHSAISSHVLEMSKLKRRRHRQAMLSFKGSFADAKLKAQTVANYRCSMAFQDVKSLAGDGTIKQFQPWMGAVLAAGMQAAGFYRSIVFKGVNANGVLVSDGSFTDQSDANLESAIENGLLAMQRPDNGGLRWNSDQTTFAADPDNFVFNSIQAVYAGDVIALTVAQRMERAFVGESLADVSASVALSFLQGIMSDLKRLKLITGDDEAPLGYRNAKITISGNAMKVEVEIKLAGAILFIPIEFLVTQVQQSASA